MNTAAQVYLAKAHENLAGAESEWAQRRTNSCARSAYYVCFHAAIAALIQAGLASPDPADGWGHAWVQASFAGHLIQRRKLHPTSLSRVLLDLLDVRRTADYRIISVSQRGAQQVVRRAQTFVQTLTTHLTAQGDTP